MNDVNVEDIKGKCVNVGQSNEGAVVAEIITRVKAIRSARYKDSEST